MNKLIGNFIQSNARVLDLGCGDGSLLAFLKKNNQVVIKVIDQGRGFKEKRLERIFDRFYSNRPDSFGEHSGLGLNIVKNLVDLHGGSVNASNNHKNRGAKIEISFAQA